MVVNLNQFNNKIRFMFLKERPEQYDYYCLGIFYCRI